MKNSFIATILIALTFSCTRFTKEERILNITEGDATLVMTIPKAGCKKCQKIIEEGLNKETGVKQSILNLHTKNLSVLYLPKVTSAEQLKTSISALAKTIPCK